MYVHPYVHFPELLTLQFALHFNFIRAALYFLPVLTPCPQYVSAQLSYGPHKGGRGVTDSVANFAETRYVK